ncbi:MAG: UbiA family prenyltransferase [Chitinispirillales bacterium]|nr:UbiA family prenyltransferase [Chitinispirillales bacterium]
MDLFFITRPVVLVPVWGFALFGYRISSQTSNIFQTINFSVILQILLFSLSAASIYVLNQIADRKVDADNSGFPLLLKSEITNKTVWVLASILAVLSTAVPFFCGHKNISALSLASILLGIAYCFAPFSFSRKPVLDFLSNALGYGTIAFSVGWILGGERINIEINSDFLRSMFPYFWMMAAGSISSTLPDYESDKANKKITTAVYFGKKTAHFVAIGCILSSIVSAVYNGKDFVALCASLIAMILYVLYVVFPQNEKLMEACYKIGGAVSILIIGLFFPILIISGMIIVVSSVLYFRIFYNVFYPSLLPAKEKFHLK